ncbi:MAG TPA: energy transducer TonB [Steroidobacteraceae bacterium]|nr:energy transducer TonB [Steroidobacteraceae bacterium]
MRARTSSIPFDQSLPMSFALLLVACATQQALQAVVQRSGDVAMSVVESSDGQSYANAGDAQWDLPYPFEENGTPAYPPELLSADLAPITVRVRIIVDEHGSVVDSLALAVPPGYPQFFAAVQAAVHDWKFWPLVKWQAVEGKRTDIEFNGWVRSYEGTATALPFHQDYDITFTQQDGKGMVTSSSPSSSSTAH